MSLRPITPNSSIDSVINQMNQNIADLNSAQNTTIFRDDAGVRRVLLGKGGSDFYGLKVSETGVDVFDADDSELIFNSDLNVFKFVKSDTINLVASAGTYARGTTLASTTIAHGLSTTPAFLLYVKVPNINSIGSNLLMNAPAFTFVDNGTNYFPGTVAFGAIDSTNLTLKVSNIYSSQTLGNDFTWTFKYYLMQEQAS